MKDYKKLARDVFDYMVEARRELHRRPCLTGDERETTEFIAKQMEALGIPYHIDGVNNLIGKIGGRPGKRIALRADTDALPMVESTGLPFSSEKEGVMHACGHDFHVANLLGAAKVLSENKRELNGIVYLCFQVSEEQSMGAFEVIEYLEKEGGVDGCFGLHVNPDGKTGSIGAKRGAIMAGSSLFEIEINGRGGHGSTPWLSLDPIKPAMETALRIAALPATRFSAFDAITVNPCSIISGSAANIVPDKAVIKGNFRFFRNELYAEIVDAIEAASEGIALSYGVTATLTFAKNHSPPMINRDEAFDRLERVLSAQSIPLEVLSEPWMGADNFAEYLNRFGGLYCFGGVTAENSAAYPVHNVRFNPDERALAVFCEVFLAYTDAFLNE